jgi:beta-lactamase superfamily II metal-dependent hydrolase
MAPDGKPVVAAWLLTHFHQDHIGGFVDYVSDADCMKETVIRSVIYNFPQNMVLDTAKGKTDQDNLKAWSGLLRKCKAQGAVIYQARTGQKFFFGNAEVEILWTFEDIQPFSIRFDRTNPTCIGFTVALEGQKLMVTGDSSAEELAMAYQRYGSYLRSDFVQLAHHGMGDGGSPREFYEAVKAKYVFNPGHGNSYGVGEKWAVSYAQFQKGKVFVRDALGICTVTLPYAGGEYESEK